MLYFLCYCNKYNEIKMCDLILKNHVTNNLHWITIIMIIMIITLFLLMLMLLFCSLTVMRR